MFIQAMRGLLTAILLIMLGSTLVAAPYAALVMDARTGKVLHQDSADTKLHPASLTKMMTLYLVFTEVRAGRLKLDQKITISRKAASQPPSRLGLKPGQKIALRYLIRATAVKSANDAAMALAEAVSGSQSAFAKRMTETARAMGMSRTTFKNPHGLTQSGHMSTARDMAVLGRRLFYDFPEYYNIFARRSTNAQVKTVHNTNRRLLQAYEGADGIKTGYTRAAGYNLVASARRGQERVIVSVFGGRSSAWRNERVAELMDLGFRKAPTYAQVRKPTRLVLSAPGNKITVAQAPKRAEQLKTSTRPVVRNFSTTVDEEALLVAMAVGEALSEASTKAVPQDPAGRKLPQVDAAATQARLSDPVDFAVFRPQPRPSDLRVVRTAAAETKPTPAVTRKRAGNWVVQLGGTHNRSDAERLLLTTALQEMEALEGSSRRLAPTSTRGRYLAQFVGLPKPMAEKACARLAARQTACQVVAIGG